MELRKQNCSGEAPVESGWEAYSLTLSDAEGLSLVVRVNL
jgi:hypothetical protein